MSDNPIRVPPYRKAKRLPPDLAKQFQICFEELQFGTAISILDSALVAGHSRRPPNFIRPAFVPPPHQLASVITLVVYPLFTTRSNPSDSLNVSNQALGYLRNVLATVGPINADFQRAFRFVDVTKLIRKGDQDDEGEDDGEHRRRGKRRKEVGLWSGGRDFWSVVGWAFNCSEGLPRRWNYWKLWLEFVTDVLESDWEERARMAGDEDEADGEGSSRAPCEEGPEDLSHKEDAFDGEECSPDISILAAYLDPHYGRSTNPKRILQALLADNGPLSNITFDPVFEKEHKNVRIRKDKDERLDLDQDKYGNYFDDYESSSSGGSRSSNLEGRPSASRKAPPPCRVAVEAVAVPFRLRLFELVSRAYRELKCENELDILYKEYSLAVRVFPLSVFSLFLSHRTSPLAAVTQVAIFRELLRQLLPSPKPAQDPARVDAESAASGDVSAAVFIRCYLPMAASTMSADDNARVSLVLENILLLLLSEDAISNRNQRSLKRAAEEGIRAREQRSRGTKEGARQKAEAVAREVLEASSTRIRMLVNL